MIDLNDGFLLAVLSLYSLWRDIHAAKWWPSLNQLIGCLLWCLVVKYNPYCGCRVVMAVALKLSDSLVEDAKPYAAAEHRSAPKRIEF